MLWPQVYDLSTAKNKTYICFNAKSIIYLFIETQKATKVSNLHDPLTAGKIENSKMKSHEHIAVT